MRPGILTATFLFAVLAVVFAQAERAVVNIVGSLEAHSRADFSNDRDYAGFDFDFNVRIKNAGDRVLHIPAIDMTAADSAFVVSADEELQHVLLPRNLFRASWYAAAGTKYPLCVELLPSRTADRRVKMSLFLKKDEVRIRPRRKMRLTLDFACAPEKDGPYKTMSVTTEMIEVGLRGATRGR